MKSKVFVVIGCAKFVRMCRGLDKCDGGRGDSDSGQSWERRRTRRFQFVQSSRPGDFSIVIVTLLTRGSTSPANGLMEDVT